ncbi:hypothetical protein RD792_005628 [Penstemon davidsonii]|uniref:Pentatricopeptide repeat-containing protein n=1 Tax=Penstemon davidsonii TaxID=160366 RepID=A0ABR0DEP5_9LAMI|nr:hypothetical protein RD792_005628 [Penstemon davidsonii]
MRDRQQLAELLRKCSQNLLYDEGKEAHGAILRMGYDSHSMITNDLIYMYAKCGRTESARTVFDKMPERNVVSWTSLMSGYLQVGNARASLLLFKEMGYSDVRPNEYTLSTNIKACGMSCALETGKQIHLVSCKSGHEWYPVVGNSIMDMYLKCRRVDEAEQMFRAMPVKSLITWNVLIAGYALNDHTSAKSLHLLKEMQTKEEMPDDFTFSSTLKACRGLGAIQEGMQIHAFLLRRGYPISSHKVLSGALIDLYAQSGCLLKARNVFTQMKVKSVISWTALITGHIRKGNVTEAMELFRELRSGSYPLDSFVLSSIISVFADFSMVDLGKQMHSFTIKIPFRLDTSVSNSILDMYLKCGLTKDAEKFFAKMEVKNVVSYTVMITGYGKHGLGKEAVQLFKKMLDEDIEPDEVTYLALLSACSHSGLVEESQEWFSKLCSNEKLRPRVEHYSCMVDVLGRAGRLEEAKKVIENMPVKDNVGIWQTLLNGCRVHKNVEMGREVGEILLRLDGENLVNYVFISNLFADVGLWKECERLRGMVKAKGLKKAAGLSW